MPVRYTASVRLVQTICICILISLSLAGCARQDQPDSEGRPPAQIQKPQPPMPSAVPKGMNK
jgi:hypothetical protein